MFRYALKRLLGLIPTLFIVVKTAGAIYLAWLGFKLLHGAVRPAPDLEHDEHGLIEGLVLLDTDIVALLDIAAVIKDGGDTQSRQVRAA